jgi:hemoglobin
MTTNTNFPLVCGDKPRLPLIAPGATPSREELRAFIEAFYARARTDTHLGPVFSRIVAEDDWPAHFDKMTDFWSAVAFGGPPFRGDTMLKHARIREISPSHFARWLEIFDATTRERFAPLIAEHLIERASQLAPSLIRAVARAREKGMVGAADLH